MSKHLTGSKRLAVIQRWLNGRDDPNWEVLPTRTEGRYIVKKRETPLNEETQENYETEETQETQENYETEETQENEHNEESDENEETQEYESPRKLLSASKPKKSKKPKETQQTYDPTIGIEILNQLKLLGQDLKAERERKEQKRYIKQVVDKRIRKPKQYYSEEQEEIEPQQEQPINETPQTYTRRNRIFNDIV